MIMKFKLHGRQKKTKIIVGCHDINCYSVEIIGAMMVTWAKMKVLTFGNIKFQLLVL